jgi:hypothetical protein
MNKAANGQIPNAPGQPQAENRAAVPMDRASVSRWEGRSRRIRGARRIVKIHTTQTDRSEIRPYRLPDAFESGAADFSCSARSKAEKYAS